MSVRFTMFLALALWGCRRPDVVLITVDTLRADHVGFLNPDSPSRTPNMDALATDGTVWTQAYSPISVTGPAFCSVMTGQAPATHGVLVNGFRGGPRLPPEAETLAERLQAERYETGAFVSGFTLRPALGLAQGFQTYLFPKEVRRRWSSGTTERALRWLSEREGRMFLWWHSYDAHGPWDRWNGGRSGGDGWQSSALALQRIPQYQRVDGISSPEYYAGGYAAAVEYADQQVGRLVDHLKRADRYDGALIVLLADHGESLTERALWFDHGTSPHVEQLHVPLAIKWPGGKRAGERRDELVSLVDLAPTVLDVVGAAPLARTDGLSLRKSGAGHRWLLGESSHCKNEPVLDCAPSGVGGKQFAVRDPSTMVLHEAVTDGVRRTVFDRIDDPGETRPTGKAAAALFEVIDATLSQRASLPEIVIPTAEGGADEAGAETEMLRSLGYVDAPGSE